MKKCLLVLLNGLGLMALIALAVAGGLVARILVGFYSPWQGR